MYAGALLMLLELLAPGFVIFFFGLSAASVGLCRFVFADAFDATWQIASFSAFCVVYLAVLRRWLKNVFMGSSASSSGDFENQYVGRVGTITSAVNPPISGRVMIGDAQWTAEADVAISEGANVKVISQSNLTLKVEEIK